MAAAQDPTAHRTAERGPMDAQTKRRLIRAAADKVIAHAEELTALDAAIGDGDHGHNMKRGFEAVLAGPGCPFGDGLCPTLLKAVGTKLVMKVGGASGPLYGTLFLALGKELAAEPTPTRRGGRLRGGGRGGSARAAKARPARRRCSTFSFPSRRRSLQEPIWRPSSRPRRSPREATVPMRAIRGRASFLGERSIGHMDPGARSSSLMIAALCDEWERLMANVGIVIVSHSPKVAEGAADMVRQMVGDERAAGLDRRRSGGRARHQCRGDPRAIDRAWSEAGVAILVDLGGAETNSEMAIEMLPEDERDRVVVCNAPIVEGAVIAATEASGARTSPRCGARPRNCRHDRPGSSQRTERLELSPWMNSPRPRPRC